jgi:hypothetical protein
MARGDQAGNHDITGSEEGLAKLPQALTERGIDKRLSMRSQPIACYGAAVRGNTMKHALVAAFAVDRMQPWMLEDEAIIYIIYDFSTQLHRARKVDDATYNGVVAKFGETEVMDLIAVCC